VTYADWHFWMSAAIDLLELLESEPDQSEAAKALAAEVHAEFKRCWPDVQIGGI
jgi:hypothetical protein